MTKIKFNAIYGVILMIAITIIIACFVYAYVSSMEKKQADDEILFDVIEYEVDNKNRLNLEIGFINDGARAQGKIRIDLDMLEFKNRTVIDTIPILVKTIDINIAEGTTTHEMNNITTLENAIHSLKITFIMGEKDIKSQHFVINKQ